jgi:FkbM family methyltransferase
LTSEHLKIRDFHLRLKERNGGTWFDFEPFLATFYCAILRPGAVALDGGANLGLHTLPMAQAVQPDGLVIAIEPVPEMLQNLGTRLRAYHLPETLTRLLPYGLSSAAGEADFYQVLHPMQHGLSGLRNRYLLENQQVKTIRVELSTLDAVCRDLTRLDFIKLDLEGAEMDALRGGRRTLERLRPVVAIEQDQFSPQYFGYTWDNLFDYFASLRYEIYDLFGLHYTEAAMFHQCAVWDFVGLPAEYPDKHVLFETVRRSMETSGVRFDSTAPLAAPPAGVTPGLRRSDLASASVLDYIGSVSNPWAQESVHVPGDAPIQFLGWAVDEPHHSVAGGVDVVIDDVPYAAAYGGYRGDVADHFKNLDCQNSGFLLLLPPGALAKGPHVVKLRTISYDRKSYYQGATLQFTID